MVREQKSSASQAVIFRSGENVVALVPFTTPAVARASTSSLAQWPTMSVKLTAPADTVSRESVITSAIASAIHRFPFITGTSIICIGFHNYNKL